MPSALFKQSSLLCTKPEVGECWAGITIGLLTSRISTSHQNKRLVNQFAKKRVKPDRICLIKNGIGSFGPRTSKFDFELEWASKIFLLWAFLASDFKHEHYNLVCKPMNCLDWFKAYFRLFFLLALLICTFFTLSLSQPSEKPRLNQSPSGTRY